VIHATQSRWARFRPKRTGFKLQVLTIRFGLHAVFRIGGGKNRALASDNVTVVAGFDTAAALSNVPHEATPMVAVSSQSNPEVYLGRSLEIAPHNRLLDINISPLDE
jgi:hypothetical protein